MIIVEKVFVDGAYSPEYVPKPYLECFFNGERFYFAQTEQDRVDIKAMQPSTPEEETHPPGAALQAVLNATPEELEEIKRILGIA